MPVLGMVVSRALFLGFAFRLPERVLSPLLGIGHRPKGHSWGVTFGLMKKRAAYQKYSNPLFWGKLHGDKP